MNPHRIAFEKYQLFPLKEEMIEQYACDVLRIYGNNEIIQYSGFSLVKDETEAKKMLFKYCTKSDFYIWFLFLEEKYLGDISLAVDSYHQYASVGCFLDKDYWGKGIMAKALKELLFYAFAEEGLHRIEAQIHEDNKRSIRFFEKFGFVFEARLKENFFVNGTFYDSKLYRMLFDEYMNLYGKMDF